MLGDEGIRSCSRPDPERGGRSGEGVNLSGGRARANKIRRQRHPGRGPPRSEHRGGRPRRVALVGQSRLYSRQRAAGDKLAGIWALGECAGSPQFTHVSEDDFRIVRDNLAGGRRSTRDRLVPYCMFTDPPLAHVGLSEGEAERQASSRGSPNCRRAPAAGAGHRREPGLHEGARRGQ